MLKLATYKDIPAILFLLKEFFQQSPYKDQSFDDTKTIQTIEYFLSNPNKSIILLYCLEDVPVGILAATVHENLFNQERVAAEMVFWISPNFRSFKIAHKLKEALEYWAKKINCYGISMCFFEDDNADKLHRVYTRWGYNRIENTYWKVL